MTTGTQKSTLSKTTWDNVPLGPPDAILGITEAFKADESEAKINLGVGAYRDNKGKPFVLDCIKKAEASLFSKYPNKEYAGISGISEFSKLASELAYGKECEALQQNRIVVSQSISGTGALRLGGEFINRFYPSDKPKLILLPNPTWGNHKAIFTDTNLKVEGYRYFDKRTNGLDINGMIQDIKNAPNGSIILLHACAHNPTGVDPTREQWMQISELLKEKDHLPFFDMAYQGFASGCPDKDAWALRKFVSEGHFPIMAQSFAKNMGLYGERAGSVSIVCATEEEKKRVESQLKIIIRPMYSNPPIHGAQLVASVLSDLSLKNLWLEEVSTMANRIKEMRSSLKNELEKAGSKLNWNHITDQIGMFCFTGLNPQQVERLTKEHHVYLTKDGRISISGITPENVNRLALAIHEVSK